MIHLAEKEHCLLLPVIRLSLPYIAWETRVLLVTNYQKLNLNILRYSTNMNKYVGYVPRQTLSVAYY